MKEFTETSFLSKDSIFLRIPPTSASIRITIDDFITCLQSGRYTYTQLIDYTYFLLKDDAYDVKQVLRIWEIRLTMLLFNNQLGFAKREAINLNNVLYHYENGTTAANGNGNSQTGLKSPSLSPKFPEASPIHQQYRPSLAKSPSVSSSSQQTQPPLQLEASRMNSMSSINSTTSIPQSSGAKQLQPIYPLPKNNGGLIDYKLMILLLRLKSLPNLTLVNELYKLCYQLRLGSSSTTKHPHSQHDSIELRVRLINLSYEIIVTLTITKNYISLIQFLKSLRYDLKKELTSSHHTDIYSVFYSNVSLVLVVITLIHCHHSGKSVPHESLDEIFTTDVTNASTNCLSYVMQQIAPVLSTDAANAKSSERVNEQDVQQGESTEETPHDADIPDHRRVSFPDLVTKVKQGQVTGRIVCSLLGLWDLTNNFHGHLKLLPHKDDDALVFRLDNVHTDFPQATSGQSHDDELSQQALQHRIDVVYEQITTQWSRYINKVYALE